MIRATLFALAALASASGMAWAQSQPNAGFQARPLKTMPEQQIADLRAGRGMGLALAAELNGYPGPSHVLELADTLALSAEQRARVQSFFAAMKAEAVPLGERLIGEEQELDRLFAEKAITPLSLESATASAGATQARLRAAHLRYHLLTVAELTPEQTRLYSDLRGYAGKPISGHGHRMHTSP